MQVNDLTGSVMNWARGSTWRDVDGQQMEDEVDEAEHDNEGESSTDEKFADEFGEDSS